MENIITEQSILKYLTNQKDCNKHIVKFKNFFESKSFYYLEMEHGGVQLFEFVKQAAAEVNKGTLHISEWQKVVNTIFKQMVDCIQYIHAHNVCHFDNSLENWLINDMNVQWKKDMDGIQRIQFDVNSISIKLCDFGCAHHFPSELVRTNRFCGKNHYQSPESVQKKYFDAKKNDIWSMGICLYLMSTFCLPYAQPNDEAYAYLMKHGAIELLNARGVQQLIHPNLLPILQSIFVSEGSRFKIEQIKEYGQKCIWN